MTRKETVNFYSSLIEEYGVIGIGRYTPIHNNLITKIMLDTLKKRNQQLNGRMIF